MLCHYKTMLTQKKFSESGRNLKIKGFKFFSSFFDVNLFVIELLIEWFLSNQPLQRKALEKFLIPGTKEKNILATKLYSKKILNVYFLHLNARITLEIQTNDILLMTLRLGHLG